MRTEYCGFMDKRLLGHPVAVKGWVHRRRDHGGVIFIDLRDREGLVQIVVNPDTFEAFEIANSVRPEYVLEVKGVVRVRPSGTQNQNLVSGEIEVLAQEIVILNTAVAPPFQIDEEQLSETTRLEYRVIDLRRPQMQKNLRLRYKVAMLVRNFLDALGFIDVETPMLTRVTPEGARDYLVPSRIHAGQFFALPQSPQLFKQLLMVAGFDRYYQIVKCFRDEDLRADRQPEFTQIDIEASFLGEEDIMEIVESMTCHLFREVMGVELGSFARMPYDEAMYYYGSDKPDLRISLKFTDLTDVMRRVPFKVFADAAQREGGRVVGLRVPGGGAFTRSEIDAWTRFVAIYGAKGLAWIKINDVNRLNEEGLQSPIIKNLTPAALEALVSRSGAKNGDIVFFGADCAKVVNEAMGALRVKIGQEKGKAGGYFVDEWRPLWVVDFPMFEYSEEEQRWVSCHHPFTSPKTESISLLKSDPEACRARAYDLVLNGWEIGGGSVRIHNAGLQALVFEVLDIGEGEAQKQFGFLLENLGYGAPPHGGLALGLDRLVAMMVGAESIRDVIAFPKTQRTQCLLTKAPSVVDENRLTDLHIRVASRPKASAIQ